MDAHFAGHEVQTTEQTLAALLRLAKDISDARKERDATKLSPESFAVYWLLKNDGVQHVDQIIKATTAVQGDIFS